MKRILIISIFILVCLSAFGQGRYPFSSIALRDTATLATVQDTLGFYSSTEGAGVLLSSDNLRATKDTAQATGYIDTIYVFMEQESSGDSIKVAIYDDDTDSPGNLLGQSNNTQSKQTAGTGWYPVPLTSQVNVTNGSYYWIAILADDSNSSRLYYISNEGNSVYGVGTWDTLPDPYSSEGQDTSTSGYKMFGEIKD